GLTIDGNTFENFNGGTHDRVDTVDTTFADLEHDQTRGLSFRANTYKRVREFTSSPVYLEHTETSANQVWDIGTDNRLPFGGRALGVDGVVAHGPIETAGGSPVFTQPYVETGTGADGNEVKLTWSEPVKGTVRLFIRSDLPLS
ncbi:MAG: right-handed parallel beta-helix repeat-containing protein, partial [Pseudomonadota bacterium]